MKINLEDRVEGLKEALHDEEMRAIQKAGAWTMFRATLPMANAWIAKRAWNRHARHIRPGKPITYKQAMAVTTILQCATTAAIVSWTSYRELTKRMNEANAEVEKFKTKRSGNLTSLWTKPADD